MIKLYFPCKYVSFTRGYSSSHKGLDMAWNSKYGGPNHNILAPADGTVKKVLKNYNKTDKTNKTYGNYVIIDHGNNIETVVAHLKYNTVRVKKGDKVKKGQVLGVMGNTGYSKGTHCHYEVKINNEKVDPLKYTYLEKENILNDATSKEYKILKITEEPKKEEKIEEKTEEKILEKVKFEYICPKTGIYKIKLMENEKILII